MTREERLREALGDIMEYAQTFAKQAVDAGVDIHGKIEYPLITAIYYSAKGALEALSAAPEAPQVGDSYRYVSKPEDTWRDEVVHYLVLASMLLPDMACGAARKRIGETIDFVKSEEATKRACDVPDIVPQVGERLFRWVRWSDRRPIYDEATGYGEAIFRTPNGNVSDDFFDEDGAFHFDDSTDDFDRILRSGWSDQWEWLEDIPPRVGDREVDVIALAQVMRDVAATCFNPLKATKLEILVMAEAAVKYLGLKPKE